MSTYVQRCIAVYDQITWVQREIINVLAQKGTSYAQPLTSEEIGAVLNITPSYIRKQMKTLYKLGFVQVRNGRGGGYFYINGGQ